MAKRENSVGGDLDRIGGLPDPVLSHILSFLPTKEAIRTSVLSPRWRYLFASMPIFDFTDCLGTLKRRNGNKFKNFIRRLLSFPNPVSLECFRLQNFSWDDNGDSHLYGWISAVLSRGVKELVLYTPVSPALSSRMFTSQSLVTLKLYPGDVIVEVPADVCLPNLKTLHLIEFILADDSIFRLISSCIVLEELVLMPEEVHDVSDIIIQNPSLKRLDLNLSVRGGRYPNNLVLINAPNLVSFHYDDDIAERYTLSSMESLQKAYIKINEDGERDPTYLVQAVCNVQSLYLSVDPTPLLSQTRPGPALAFNNLVDLHLVHACGEWLVDFLHCVPILKTLILFQTFADEGFRHEKVPPCLSHHLKEITFSEFMGDQVIFELIIGYFLKHALVLEKLKFRVSKWHSRVKTSLVNKITRLARNRGIEVSVEEMKEEEM